MRSGFNVNVYVCVQSCTIFIQNWLRDQMLYFIIRQSKNYLNADTILSRTHNFFSHHADDQKNKIHETPKLISE